MTSATAAPTAAEDLETPRGVNVPRALITSVKPVRDAVFNALRFLRSRPKHKPVSNVFLTYIDHLSTFNRSDEAPVDILQLRGKRAIRIERASHRLRFFVKSPLMVENNRFRSCVSTCLTTLSRERIAEADAGFYAMIRSLAAVVRQFPPGNLPQFQFFRSVALRLLFLRHLQMARELTLTANQAFDHGAPKQKTEPKLGVT